jgi:hypothetical protein
MAGIDEAFQGRLGGVSRKDGRLFLRRPDQPGEEEPVAVTVRYLRPLTARTELVFLDEKQREVVTVTGLDALQGEERALVEEALGERYLMAAIQRVRRIDVQFGTRYWQVETDRGPRWFALREPGKNAAWLNDTHLVLRDTAGNRYEIPDLNALDAPSRRRVRRSL